MTITRNWCWACLLLLGMGVVGCGTEAPDPGDTFDRQAMLENLGTNLIVPAYQSFAARTDALADATEALAEDLTESKLVAAQATWKAAALQWKATELYNLGPVDDLALRTSIDNWPTNANALENAIADGTTINEAYVHALGSSSKGLPALEYLLFDKEAGNAAILEQLEDDAKRVAYLVALTQDLRTLAHTLYDAWNPAAGNYLATFTAASGKDVGSATNQLANQLLVLTEEVKNQKLGIPLGKKSMGVKLPNNVEAWRSSTSLELLQANVDALKNVFTGQNGSGFDDYLHAVNAQYNGEALATAITNQFAVVEQSLAAISVPLQDALETENDKVETAYAETQRLVILLKTDMMSSLGLLVTYSDNDGD
ncbi:imelysin family protein [Catalinimonas alkaloidigena]|nr:imelysin family protein [Catalinimonas alkaloidigena]